MSLHTNSESKGSDLMRNPVPEGYQTSLVLAAHFGGAPSAESLTASVRAELEKYCTPGNESAIEKCMQEFYTKMWVLNQKFEIAIAAITDESGELIAELRGERDALVTTANTQVALANLRADGRGRAGTARILEEVSMA